MNIDIAIFLFWNSQSQEVFNLLIFLPISVMHSINTPSYEAIEL